MQHKTIIGETVEIKSFGEIYRKLLTTSLCVSYIYLKYDFVGYLFLKTCFLINGIKIALMLRQ